MSSLRIKKVNIRKEHKCFACGDKHFPGEIMESNTGVWEGEISTVYWCEICYGYVESIGDRRFWEDYEDGIGQSELQEDRRYKEYRREFLTNKQRESEERGTENQWAYYNL